MGSMRIAITGSNGLIGTALTRSLRADGHDVVRLVRHPSRAGGVPLDLVARPGGM
ncbi:NAD-dependent epimerase/dehydratase family protein, partial [Streptomyces niveus]|uniref:NAD-dependent epimerase/dehydratase family protein n=1 Tax=Streptomyces niveus TaxID=193462 RepID=UPI00114CEE5C